MQSIRSKIGTNCFNADLWRIKGKKLASWFDICYSLKEDLEADTTGMGWWSNFLSCEKSKLQ
jgi:hypothetical protein